MSQLKTKYISRKLYVLNDFFADYSRSSDKYCIFIKIDSLGRQPAKIIKTLNELKIKLEDLSNNPEYIIEEYEYQTEAKRRFKDFTDNSWDIRRWIYYRGLELKG